MSETDRSKVLILSPHLDDAVFSCGAFVHRCAEATVATVFAGIPTSVGGLTTWDACSGFACAHEAMTMRREEDRRALSILNAQPVWLDFLDSQYGDSPSVEAVAAAIAALLESRTPDTVLFPAGLFHSDHVLVHRAALQVLPDYPQASWLMYEDALYRRIPGMLQERLATLLEENRQATPLALPPGSGTASDRRKREAIYCYASQLRALEATVKNGGYGDAFTEERLWRLQAVSRKHEEQ
jgi:LmbE family N-acetylglucosaminyl deacetylase